MNKTNENSPIRPILLKLAVYESFSFPIKRKMSVRSTANSLKDTENLHFVTKKCDRDLIVTRIK